MKNGLWKKLTACALAAVLCMAPVTETGAFSVAEESAVETAKGDDEKIDLRNVDVIYSIPGPNNSSIQLMDLEEGKEEESPCIYSGKPIEPVIQIIVGGQSIELKKGTDYNIFYTRDDKALSSDKINVDAGYVTVYAQALEGSRYTYQTKPLRFYIRQADLSKAEVVLKDKGELTWNGQEQTQEVESVTIESTLMGDLKLDQKDYIVSDNKNTEVGKYKLTITPASDNLTGSQEVDYSIGKAKKGDFASFEYTVRYNTKGELDFSSMIETEGRIRSYVLSGTGNSAVLNLSVSQSNPTKLEYTVDSSTQAQTQTFQLKVSITGCKNYEDYDLDGTLIVSSKAVPTITFRDVTDGKLPKVYGDIPAGNGTASVEEADYTGSITYSFHNVDDETKRIAEIGSDGLLTILNAGEVNITATAEETEGYIGTSASYTLTVERKPVQIQNVKVSDKVYDGDANGKLVIDDVTIEGVVQKDQGELLIETKNSVCTFEDENVGNNKKVTVEGLELTGDIAANYTISAINEVYASITKKGIDQPEDIELEHTPGQGTFSTTIDKKVPSDDNGRTYTPSTPVISDGSSVQVTTFTISDSGEVTIKLENGKRGDEITLPITIVTGNYKVTGSNTDDISFNIHILLTGTTEARSIADALVDVTGTFVYDGTSQIPDASAITVTLGEDILDPSLDYTTEVKNNLNAGTATVTVTGRDDAGYKDSATGTFDIQRREIAISGAIVKTRPYEAQKKTMDISVVDFVEASGEAQTVSLGNGSDYTAKGSVQSDTAGEKAVIVTVTIRNKNYLLNESTTTVTGEITKIDRETASLERITRYGTGAQIPLTPYIEAGGSVGTISISGNDEIFAGMSITGASTAGKENILTYQLKDDEKYNKETATLSVPITGATNYNDYTIEVKVTVNDCLHLHTTTVDDEGASCTKEGYTGNIKCMDCGQIISTGEPIPALGHAYSSYIRRPMTPFVDGIRTYVCDRCGDTYSELIEAEEDEDAYDDLYTDAKVNGAASMTSVTVITDDDGAITSVTTVKIDEEPVSVITTDETTGESSESSRIWIGGLEESYVYNGSAIKPEVRVYDGVNQLTPKKDYTVSYSNNKNATKEAAVKIKFKGSYQGTEDAIAYFTIEPAVLGRDVEFTDISVVENGKFQNPKPGALWVSSGKAISSSQFSVAYFTDDGLISLEDGLLEAGTYKAHVIGATENFRETGEATVSVVEKIESSAQLSKATVTMSPKKYSYTGSAIVPAEKIGYQLKIKGQFLVEGEDYERTAIYNNVNPGTATVVFTAIDKNKKGLVGSKTATFKIVGGKSLDSSGISVSYNNAVIYEKGGVGTTIKIRDNGTLLKEGTDYTVKYTKNKKATSGNTAVATITGKGKYKKSIRRLYAIERQDISELSVQVEDKLQSKSGYTNPKVTITDLNGKKLDKKDYTLSGYTKPDANGLVQVTITGTGSYKGARTVSYRYITKAMQLSKVKAGKITDQEYTGGEVYLSKQALTNVLYTGSKSLPDYLTPGEDFTVSSYSNNTKKGKAKVTLKGIGNYGGTKTVSFTITQKQGEFLGALIGGSWDTK